MVPAGCWRRCARLSVQRTGVPLQAPEGVAKRRPPAIVGCSAMLRGLGDRPATRTVNSDLRGWQPAQSAASAYDVVRHSRGRVEPSRSSTGRTVDVGRAARWPKRKEFGVPAYGLRECQASPARFGGRGRGTGGLGGPFDELPIGSKRENCCPIDVDWEGAEPGHVDIEGCQALRAFAGKAVDPSVNEGAKFAGEEESHWGTPPNVREFSGARQLQFSVLGGLPVRIGIGKPGNPDP